MDGILKQSYFIPAKNHKDFMKIFKKYVLNDDKKETDYYEIASVLFCILEDSIRRIIVSISSNCDQNKDNESFITNNKNIGRRQYIVCFIYFLESS